MSVNQIEFYVELQDYIGLLVYQPLGHKVGKIKLDELPLNVSKNRTLSFESGITVHFTRVRMH